MALPRQIVTFPPSLRVPDQWRELGLFDLEPLPPRTSVFDLSFFLRAAASLRRVAARCVSRT